MRGFQACGRVYERALQSNDLGSAIEALQAAIAQVQDGRTAATKWLRGARLELAALEGRAPAKRHKRVIRSHDTADVAARVA